MLHLSVKTVSLQRVEERQVWCEVKTAICLYRPRLASRAIAADCGGWGVTIRVHALPNLPGGVSVLSTMHPGQW